MKKKVLVLLIVLIMWNSLGIIIPTFAGNEQHQVGEPVSVVDDCDCCDNQDMWTTSFGNTYSVMSNPLDCTQLTISQPVVSLVDTPASFSWKNVDGVDWTTEAKHQGNCGSCWDFAALGALESRIKIAENCSQLQPDLSEQYVLSCLPAAANNYGQGCLGGTPFGAYYYILDTSLEGNFVNGIISETCFPYMASHTVLCDEKCVEWMDHLVPLVSCNYTFHDLGYATPENTEVMKTLIYTYGPLAVALNVTQDFITYWDLHHDPSLYYPDTHEPWGNRLNHIVVVVGWYDDPDIPNGGYWIVKNSWGTEWGYDGFFNIEYYGLFIGMYYAQALYNASGFDWPPIADAGGFYSAEVGENIVFDGGGSVDPEQNISLYEWNFGDNTTGYGPTPSHSYDSSGVYMVNLTVSDVVGNVGYDTAVVGVGMEPLLLDATGILGVDITVENTFDYAFPELTWTVVFTGHILSGQTDGVIPSLDAHQMVTLHIPVIGLGFGSLTVMVENIEHTERFFVLGPLVLGLRVQ